MVNKHVYMSFQTVEHQLKRPLDIYLDKDSTIKEAFGDFNDWTVEQNGLRFFLNPINRRWLYYDFIHEEWKDTKLIAGDTTDLLERKKGNHGGNRDNTTLILHNGRNTKTVFPVEPNTLIGNGRICDIKLSGLDPETSYVLILQHKGGYTLFKLKDHHSILVNGSQASKGGTSITDGDDISIESIDLKFCTPKSAQTAEPTSTTVFGCRKCGAELSEMIKFCTTCGTPEPTKAVSEKNIETRICPHSKETRQPHQKFCTNCGDKNSVNELNIHVCDKCGHEHCADEKFCTNCGERRDN